MATNEQQYPTSGSFMIPPYTMRFQAIGTHWQIDTSTPLADTVVDAITDYVEYYDKTYSRFRSDSLVTKLANKPGTYTFPDDILPLINFYRSLYDMTDGKITPLIGGMLERAGYDANYSLRRSAQTALASWDAAMTWSGSSVTISEPIVIDIGAAGKGYLIDKISAILEREGIEEYLIDASGDMIHKGTSEVVVGLEHPHNPSKVIGTVAIHNESLCASASNRRSWGADMHHIFDPQTMKPTRDIIATWVIANTAMVADGLATALFFTDPDKLLQVFEFEYVRMHSDGSVRYSSKFEGALFT